MLTTVTRVVLAAAVGLTMAATSLPAAAQEQPAESSVVAQPEPADPVEVPQPTITSAIAVCDGGKSGVEVIIEDRLEPYKVILKGSDLPARETEFDEDHAVHRTVFSPVPVGEYTVEIEGADSAADGVPVVVKPCADLDPGKGELDIEVQCKAGWGLVTFVVANPGSDEVRTFALEIHGSPAYESIELAPGLFLRIHENLFDDGGYQAVLTGDGLAEPLVREFAVKCAAENAPGLGTYAQCDDKDDVTTPAVVWVEIANPNRAAVDYTVKAGKANKTVNVAGGGNGSVDLGGFPAGDYPVTVLGSDGTETVTGVAVDHCADVEIDEDGLQIAVRCVDGKSIVTARFFAVGPYPATREFGVDGSARYDETVEFAGDGPYQWTRHTGKFEDGTYTARLTGSGLETVEQFTVACVPTTPPATTPPVTTTPAPQGSAGPSTDDSLPVTGAAVGGMVALGLAALGLGGFLVIAARRRKTSTD
ncbi:hypothetical protein [Actinokineospora sp.]|uniref:hypothetical protein n=1 Tax=Actinokineospora sp. TaxID=1872133 RepID=UPI0040377BBD